MRIGTVRADGSILLDDENIKFREAMTKRFQRIRQTTKQRVFLAENGLTAVTSSFISAIGTRDDDLFVRFHNSSFYIYYGYAHLYEDMLRANSKGQFFNRYVRPTRRYEKIDNVPFPTNLGESPLAYLEDQEMMTAMDMDYIRKVISQFTGAELYMEDKIINGINFTEYKVNDIVILRPIVLRH